MKKICKRLFSLTLALLMLLPAMSQIATAANNVNLPTIYVMGKYNPVYNKDETEVLYPLNPPIAETVKDNARSLYASYQLAHQTNSDAAWKKFADDIYNVIAPRYEPVMMDGNGNPRNGTHTLPLELPRNYAKERGTWFWLHDYQFTYDSRLDPYENARLLNIYINNVLAVTGQKQVNLIGRCLGSTVVSTYLTEYFKMNSQGKPIVNTCIFYAPAFNGVYMMDGFFSSDFDLDYNKIQTFLKQGYSDELGNFDTLRSVADALDKFSLWGWGVDSANDALQKSAKYLFPRLTLAIFGTWPGHWAMISKDAFQKALKTTLENNDENKAKYAGLIQKVTKYQDNVMAKFPQTLENCRQRGMRVAIFSKYNIPMIPLSPASDMQADGTVQLSTMSLGATAGVVGGTLTNAYINGLKDENMGAFVSESKNAGKNIYLDSKTNAAAIRRSNYLSKDNMVDASTCQYPDYTWFIKNCPHATYPKQIDDLFQTIFRSPTQYTVTSDPEYPQFLVFDKDAKTVSPVTGPDAGKKEEQTASSSFFKKIADWIIDFVNKIMKFFGM